MGSIKRGLRGENWGTHWLNNLKANNMRGKDFVLLAPTNKSQGFQYRIAPFGEILNVQRYLFMKAPLNYTPEQALEKASHRWRHLYLTAARQVGVSDEGQEEVGHRQKGSMMSRRYDSKGSMVELMSKNTVMIALERGWNIA